MKKIIFYLLTGLIAASCSYQEMYFDSVSETDLFVQGSSNLEKIEQRMSHKSGTRSLSYSITPYLYHGDTVMFIVNYVTGWELLSNDTSLPMVLASSKDGQFDVEQNSDNFAFGDYVESIAERLYDRRIQGLSDTELTGEWNLYSNLDSLYLKDTLINSGNNHRDPDVFGYTFVNPDGTTSELVPEGTVIGQGRWVKYRLLSETEEIVEEQSHLLETHWHQDAPWNVCTPLDNGKHSLAGCVSVALGQYFYYTHENFGRPIEMPTTYSYDTIYNSYTFGGFSPYVWDGMELVASHSSPGTNSVAIMLGYIGKCVNTTYSSSASGASASSYCTYLNNLGFNPQLNDLTDDGYVKSLIFQRKPILLRIARLTEDNVRKGHLLVIDAAKTKRTTVRELYGWLGYDKNGNSTVRRNNDGSVHYDYECIHTSYFDEDFYSMNWGWGINATDNIWFSSATDSDWAVGSRHYNYSREIIKTNL